MCLLSAQVTIPFTKQCGATGRIPGWNEYVAPLRRESIFWHNMWKDCNRPSQGVVANIMRRTRARYHAAIRSVRKRQADIINDRLATALANNNGRQFWSEINSIRHSKRVVSPVVDGCTDSSDIADIFASQYHNLYSSVSYDSSEMCNIQDVLNVRIESECITTKYVVTPGDFISAIAKLKAGKRDGYACLYSDHLINACDELSVYVSLLFTSMLVHGCASDDMYTSTIIPIPKGRSAEACDSCKYRGIALSSIFGKVFDLIFLDKFSDKLCTSDLQFGFKRKHSTTMCSMVMKECLAYYAVDGGSAFCTLLDATKAFDRVNYCKLFKLLLKRSVPPIYLRFLLNLYTNNVARVSWNGILSMPFTVENGVKQGGVISPVLFCLYFDGLLLRLREAGIGCYIGHVYVGALAYADDLTLLAPTLRAMHLMLQICDEYSNDFCMSFNATKSVSLHIGKRKLCADLHFSINGSKIEFVSSVTHLGHIIEDNLEDKSDISSKRNSLCAKVNNVLCYFGNRDSAVKLKLLQYYCSDFYGSVLWDLCHPFIENICVAWRKGLRRAAGLPYNTHSAFLAPLCAMLPLRIELALRTARFIGKCLHSENAVVKAIICNAVYCSRAQSVIGRNVLHCCDLFGVPLYSLHTVNRKLAICIANCYLPNDCRSVIVIIEELLLVRRNQLILSSSSFSRSDVDVLIEYLCTA